MSRSTSLVLLRHGQSRWNLENRFTGWTDVPLTSTGRAEAIQAADLIKAHNFGFDLAWTSVLHRAIETLEIMLDILGLKNIQIQQSWRLNERHYGALQGLNKAAITAMLGEELVLSWRRSYEARPPALSSDDPRHPRFDYRYAGLPAEDLPCTESLKDTEIRLMPLWKKEILPAINSGARVLIVAHGNSLRALVRRLEGIPPNKVQKLVIPTGVPWLMYQPVEKPLFQHEALSG